MQEMWNHIPPRGNGVQVYLNPSLHMLCPFCGKSGNVIKDEKIHYTGGDLLYVELQMGVLKEIIQTVILATVKSEMTNALLKLTCMRTGVISDLHAVDAGYHADCMSRFIGAREVRVAQNFKEISKLKTKHSQYCSPMLSSSRLYHTVFV